MSPSPLWTPVTPPSSRTQKAIHHSWFLGFSLLPVPLKSLSDWKHRSLCCSATTLTSSEKKKYTAVETSPAEVPQVMKPLPSQGSDKHHILSSSLHSLRRSPFFLFFALYVSTIGAHKAIYQQTELTVMLFILSVLCRKDCKSRVCVFSGTNTLFISKTAGKHSSPMLAARRKQSIAALPSSNTAWKNQPSSMKKIPAAIPAEKKDLSSQYP